MAAQVSKPVDIEKIVKTLMGDEWMVKCGIGGVLAAAALVAILYSFLCLPIFVACEALMIGYCLRCMRQKAANPESKLPEWNEWGDLFASGITWIALQTGIWLFFGSIQGLILAFCCGFAFNEKSPDLSSVWTIAGCGVVSLAVAIMSALSSYTMVNFAIEENKKAAFSFIKVARAFLKYPTHLGGGFLLATGIQWLSVIIPCITLIGVFLVPSSFFVGQVLSSIILARHWQAWQES
ncbi:MAG: DUF4013 domain-containing protein [Candidatus Obscuribacterales bacterium]|nr:DUF4013 domain-containing protein [Candidatus Obscuribacterales bacterium]